MENRVARKQNTTKDVSQASLRSVVLISSNSRTGSAATNTNLFHFGKKGSIKQMYPFEEVTKKHRYEYRYGGIQTKYQIFHNISLRFLLYIEFLKRECKIF